MANQNVIIGIDLGTTYSCVSCWDEKTQRAEVIPSSSGRTMPSWVSFLPNGKLTGSAAKAQSSTNSKNTVFDVKRIIGRSYQDPVVQEEKKRFPFEVIECNGQPKIIVEWYNNLRKELSPEEISAMILAELKRAAEAYLGFPISDAVITVPAHFNNQQRQATKDAGLIAGLNVRRIINEPTAAALAYGLHNKNKESDEEGSSLGRSNVVIFDLGGGTFDVSVLAMNEGVFEVKATGGDTHLGGEDFDNAVVDYLLSLISEQHGLQVGKQIKGSNRSMSRLRRVVENAKRTLSTSQCAEIEVDSIVDGIDFTTTLSRSKFEEINHVYFLKCIDTVKSVLADASISTSDVTDVVLVGGSTRIPALQSQLYNLFDGKVELSKSVHPDEAVAVGAAVQGYILATGGSGGGKDLALLNSSTDLLLLDVTPLSLGIELEGRVMSTLIKRNTAIPCKKTRTYTTVEDFQTSIDVCVYEGERTCVDANNKLGSFVISGIQREKAGVPQIDVTFALDSNGILNVSARDQITRAEANAIIKAEKGRLTPEDIERMIADAEYYRAQDEAVAQKAAYRTALEEALYTAQSSTKARSTNPAVNKELADLMDWLELDSDSATLDDMKIRARVLEDNYGVTVSIPSQQ